MMNGAPAFHSIADRQARQAIRQVQDGIDAACRFLGWQFSMTPHGDGIVPRKSLRFLLRREAFGNVWPETEWMVDVVAAQHLRGCPGLADGARRASREAGRPGGYRIVTESSLPCTLSGNLRRCALALDQPERPDAARAFHAAQPPPGGYATAAVLLRRMDIQGTMREAAWSHVLAAIGCGHLVTDLRLPLGDATLLHRPARFRETRRLRMPDGSPGPLLRHTLPPWCLGARWHET